MAEESSLILELDGEVNLRVSNTIQDEIPQLSLNFTVSGSARHLDVLFEEEEVEKLIQALQRWKRNLHGLNEDGES